MGAVFFYHLTRRPLEAALPVLLEKSREQGWRVVIRGRKPEMLDWLDEKLWLVGDDAGFLPHGRSGGAHDAAQPILLTDGAEVADCLMSVDGAELSAEEIKASERACVFFDGNDDEALQRARGQWKSLTEAGCAAQYWSEDSGRWEKKAESSG